MKFALLRNDQFPFIQLIHHLTTRIHQLGGEVLDVSPDELYKFKLKNRIYTISNTNYRVSVNDPYPLKHLPVPSIRAMKQLRKPIEIDDFSKNWVKAFIHWEEGRVYE